MTSLIEGLAWIMVPLAITLATGWVLMKILKEHDGERGPIIDVLASEAEVEAINEFNRRATAVLEPLAKGLEEKYNVRLSYWTPDVQAHPRSEEGTEPKKKVPEPSLFEIVDELLERGTMDDYFKVLLGLIMVLAMVWVSLRITSILGG